MFIIMIIIFVQHWFYLRLIYRHVDNVYVTLLLTNDKFIWRKFLFTQIKNNTVWSTFGIWSIIYETRAITNTFVLGI